MQVKVRACVPRRQYRLHVRSRRKTALLRRSFRAPAAPRGPGQRCRRSISPNSWLRPATRRGGTANRYMPRADRTRARRAASVFLTHGFRPFFLAGGVWSAAALLVWMVVFASGGNLPSRFDPLAWQQSHGMFVRLRHGDNRRISANRASQLDRAPACQRRSAGAARGLMAAGPHRLSHLGPRPCMACGSR